jgi:hypothetical protein
MPVVLRLHSSPFMDWMNLGPGWLMLAALSFIALCALWTGTLFSVSWLTGRARMMADGPEIGGLALALHRHWTIPQAVLSFLTGFVWLAGGPSDRLRAHWVYGVIGAWVTMLLLHMAVGSRAARVVRGSKRASKGEGIRRVALVVSFGAIIALSALRTSLLP